MNDWGILSLAILGAMIVWALIEFIRTRRDV